MLYFDKTTDSISEKDHGRPTRSYRPSPGRTTLLDLKNVRINDSEIQQVQNKLHLVPEKLHNYDQ